MPLNNGFVITAFSREAILNFGVYRADKKKPFNL